MMKTILIGILFLPMIVAAQSLQVSSNGRYLQTADGKPFFWVGDTGWELLHRLNRKETLLYLDTRKKQGFNVIQTVIISEDNGLRIANASGDLPLIHSDPSQPNEAYFRHVDFVVDAAQKRGMWLALLPTWADQLPSDRKSLYSPVFNERNAEEYGAFLARRYAGKPVIWILGGDRRRRIRINARDGVVDAVPPSKEDWVCILYSN